MSSATHEARTLRFGSYEVDLAAGELSRNGVRIRLEAQPFRLLATLLQRPGDLVTREEIRQLLWPDTPFVDFDNGLNTAIRKIRRVLNDSATKPRFVETLPRRGYRFIAQVQAVDRPAAVLTTPPILMLALAVSAAVIAGLWFRAPGRIPPAPVVKFAYTPGNSFQEPVISPDGRFVAYAGGEGDGTLWLQDLAETAPREIKGTEGARRPFWSPGSDFLGFAAGPQLKKVSVDRDVVATLCELRTRDFRGGTWAQDGKSIVFRTLSSNLYEVSAQGGAPKPLDPETGAGDRPHFLPSSAAQRVLLSTVGDFVQRTERAGQIALHRLETGERTILGDGRFPVYSPTGHVIYQTVEDTSALWALPFSAETLRPTGYAFPIAQNASHPSVSRDGTLVYREGPRGGVVQLFWRDRDGNKLAPIGQPQEGMKHVSLSPDGRRVAIRGLESGNFDIWLHDTIRPRKERFTFERDEEHNPVWSPAGEDLVFGSRPWRRTDLTDMLLQRVDRSSNAIKLLGGPEINRPTDWSRDGRFILYYKIRPGPPGLPDSEIWYLKRVGDRGESEEIPFAQDPESQCCATFSPDGRFVIYSSRKTGRMEIWVSPFPERTTEWPVSTAGGRQPRWSKDGTEIFYVEGDTLVAVKVTTTPTFSVGSKEELFRSDSFLGSYLPQYDVTADGQRFVVAGRVDEDRAAVIRVVQNWYEEFRDREQD